MSKNPLKITFTLKQHTPIIHFQWEQDGAILRASELKPKLDRFLLKRNSKLPKQKAQKNALNYQVKIIQKDTTLTKKIPLQRNPLYFGKVENSIFTDGAIEISFISKCADTIKSIKDYFPYFISVTNFGTRQSKGFGCFFLAGYNIEEFLPANTYSIVIRKNDIYSIQNTIAYFYKRLRSGVNTNSCDREYHRSFIPKFISKDTKWEKRWIKEEFFGLRKNNASPYFYRALLGLPGSFTYRKYKPCNQQYEENAKVFEEYEVKVDHEYISRYKSPLIFKPVIEGKNTIIYVIQDEIQLLDTEFSMFLRMNIKSSFKYKGKNTIDEDRNGNPKFKTEYFPKNGSFISSDEIDRVRRNFDDLYQSVCQQYNDYIQRDVSNRIKNFNAFLEKHFESVDGGYIPVLHRIKTPKSFSINDFINSFIESLENKLISDEYKIDAVIKKVIT